MSGSADALRGALGAPIALPRWQRYAIYASLAALVLSGIAWLWAAWPLVVDSADALPARARSVALWALRLHGVAAYVALVVAGSVLTVHVRLGWSRRRNRASGSVMATLFVVLAASGLWLYYGGEAGRRGVSLAHWILGLAVPVWLVMHRALGLRSRRRAAG